MKKNSTRTLVIIAMLGALSALLMFLEFSVPFAPPFVKFDFSDLPVLIGGFLYGPYYGMIAAALKILLKLVIKPTSTMFIGELSNFILCVIFMFTASMIYRRQKTRKQAVIGMIVSTIVTSVLAIITNYFFIFPMYAKMFGMSMDAIVQMVVAVNPLVHDVMGVMLCSLLPFNLFKYGMISLITFLIYKKISVILKRYTA